MAASGQQSGLRGTAAVQPRPSVKTQPDSQKTKGVLSSRGKWHRGFGRHDGWGHTSELMVEIWYTSRIDPFIAGQFPSLCS